MMTEMEFIQFLNKKSVSESESSPTEVISHAVLFVRPLPGAHAKKRARVPHEMVLFVLKISHMAISMESTPLLENGMHLRCPTPIMAPGLYTFSDRNSAKNIPFGAPHMACIREYHPPGCIIPQREQVHVYL